MKRAISIITFVLLCVFPGFAQTPMPQSADEEDDIVKISTNLIQVDVTVTDRKGRILKDLKPEDFEIFENGKKQEITNFSFVSAEQIESEKTEVDKNALPLPPQKVKPEQVRRTIALVVDDLTLSFESTYYVRRALRKFVNEQMQPGDLVAIIRTGAGIGALQQFTTDKRVLRAAIKKIRWNVTGKKEIGAFAPFQRQPRNQFVNPATGENEGFGDSEDDRNLEADINEFRENLYTTGTLGAINYIVRGMRDLPGRKSVMLFSDGFSLQNTNSNGFINSTRIFSCLERLIDLANRASVVIYTIDARGLQIGNITAADNVAGLSGRQLSNIVLGRRQKLFDTQSGLIYLARQTGGLSFINNNDISGSIGKMLDDQSYYLIGYQPDGETFDPRKRRFNDLDIKVKRKNIRVRYRSGFFGISDELLDRSVKNTTASNKLLTALASPFARNEVDLGMNTVFKSDAEYKNYVSTFLHLKIKDLKFTDEPDGTKLAVIDILAAIFGDNGTVIDEVSKYYTIRMKEDIFRKVSDEGFVYYFTFPIKKYGAYQMRVAVRDRFSDKIGSASQFIEIPRLKKKRLALSGIMIENLSREQWRKTSGAKVFNSGNAARSINPMADTALRIFKRGTVVNYGFEIYNAHQRKGKTPQIQTQVRIFRDGKIIYESEPNPVDLSNQTNLKMIKAGGAFALGDEMKPGDYVLQIIATDNLAKKRKYKTTTEFVQFEVVE